MFLPLLVVRATTIRQAMKKFQQKNPRPEKARGYSSKTMLAGSLPVQALDLVNADFVDRKTATASTIDYGA